MSRIFLPTTNQFFQCCFFIPIWQEKLFLNFHTLKENDIYVVLFVVHKNLEMYSQTHIRTHTYTHNTPQHPIYNQTLHPELNFVFTNSQASSTIFLKKQQQKL